MKLLDSVGGVIRSKYNILCWHAIPEMATSFDLGVRQPNQEGGLTNFTCMISTPALILWAGALRIDLSNAWMCYYFHNFPSSKTMSLGKSSANH